MSSLLSLLFPGYYSSNLKQKALLLWGCFQLLLVCVASTYWHPDHVPLLQHLAHILSLHPWFRILRDYDAHVHEPPSTFSSLTGSVTLTVMHIRSTWVPHSWPNRNCIITEICSTFDTFSSTPTRPVPKSHYISPLFSASCALSSSYSLLTVLPCSWLSLDTKIHHFLWAATLIFMDFVLVHMTQFKKIWSGAPLLQNSKPTINTQQKPLQSLTLCKNGSNMNSLHLKNC